MSKPFEVRLGPVISGWVGEPLANHSANMERIRGAVEERQDRLAIRPFSDRRLRLMRRAVPSPSPWSVAREGIAADETTARTQVDEHHRGFAVALRMCPFGRITFG